MWDTLLSSPAVWFTVPAFVGTLLFSLKLAMLMLVGDADDPGAMDATQTGSGPAAEVFSIGAVLVFIMGLGWAGLGAIIALGWGALGASLLGITGGLALVALYVLAMQSLRRMNASGNIELSRTAGKFGEVTLTVPAAGTGRGEVRLILGDREKRCDAISAAGPLPTKTRVRVAAVNADNTVTVEPI